MTVQQVITQILIEPVLLGLKKINSIMAKAFVIGDQWTNILLFVNDLTLWLSTKLTVIPPKMSITFTSALKFS